MIKQLNKDNFIIWTGEFAAVPFAAVATDDGAQIGLTALSVDIYPLANDVATYGINTFSFEFVLQDNPAKPAVWDPVAKKITYYPPEGIAVGTNRLLQYKWKDTLGNESNVASINIAVNARATAWRGYAPSYTCSVDIDGSNTGFGVYAQLEKYYTDTLEAVLPQELALNTEGAPNYIAPDFNSALCPVGTQVRNLNLFTYNPLTAARINSITLQKAGEDDIVFGALSHTAMDAQPRLINVPGTSFDNMIVQVYVRNLTEAPQTIAVTFTPGAGGVGELTQSLEIEYGTYTEVFTFPNITFGTTFAGDIIFE